MLPIIGEINHHSIHTIGVLSIYSHYVTLLSAWRQKGITGYCVKCIDRPFCLRTDDMLIEMRIILQILALLKTPTVVQPQSQLQVINTKPLKYPY